MHRGGIRENTASVEQKVTIYSLPIGESAGDVQRTVGGGGHHVRDMSQRENSGRLRIRKSLRDRLVVRAVSGRTLPKIAKASARFVRRGILLMELVRSQMATTKRKTLCGSPLPDFGLVNFCFRATFPPLLYGESPFAVRLEYPSPILDLSITAFERVAPPECEPLVGRLLLVRDRPSATSEPREARAVGVAHGPVPPMRPVFCQPIHCDFWIIQTTDRFVAGYAREGRGNGFWRTAFVVPIHSDRVSRLNFFNGRHPQNVLKELPPPLLETSQERAPQFNLRPCK
jgi:hypothetical protein